MVKKKATKKPNPFMKNAMTMMPEKPFTSKKMKKKLAKKDKC